MMKALLLGLSLLAASFAYADTDADIRVNRIEMTGVALDESDDSNTESDDSKATDYNSSRSNKAGSAAPND